MIIHFLAKLRSPTNKHKQFFFYLNKFVLDILFQTVHRVITKFINKIKQLNW